MPPTIKNPVPNPPMAGQDVTITVKKNLSAYVDVRIYVAEDLVSNQLCYESICSTIVPLGFDTAGEMLEVDATDDAGQTSIKSWPISMGTVVFREAGG